MTRYTLRALATQWRAWSGTVAVLAFAAGLVNVCLVHRMTVTRSDVVAAARAAGVDPAELTVPGVSVAFYTAMVTVPVVAVVGQSCVQALRTSWALWRPAGGVPGGCAAAAPWENGTDPQYVRKGAGCIPCAEDGSSSTRQIRRQQRHHAP